MTKGQPSMLSEDAKPQIKYKGIYEPAGRVKNLRVEIRPPNSKKKIWVGTFETRQRAMRAYDAAVYLTGKDPYYYLYPKSYFPTRPKEFSKECIQIEAKKYADRDHEYPLNPSSLLPNSSKPGSVEVAPDLTGKERITLMPPDVKVVQKMDFALLDELLQKDDYELFQKDDYELFPPLNDNSLGSLDLTAEEAKSAFWGAKADVEASKAGVEEPKCGMKEFEAFDKGYNNPDFDVLSELLERDPPGTILPSIKGESVFYSQVMPLSSKRKRDAIEGSYVAKDHISVGSSESDAIDVAGDSSKNLFDMAAASEPPLTVEDYLDTGMTSCALASDSDFSEPVLYWS